MMMNLETFFEEKEIPYTNWEIEHDGETHFIDSDVVIEAILATKVWKGAKLLVRFLRWILKTLR
jgi:hypothetical protein